MNNDRMPTRKVGIGALGGALSVLLVWGLQQSGMEVSAEISSAFTMLLTFALSYFVSEKVE